MLDFTKSSKRFMAINLIDDTSLLLRMPTKRVFDALVSIRDRLSNLKLDDLQTINEVYALLAVILSNNLNHIEVSVEYLSDLLDFEDVSILYSGYMDFVKGVTTDPNSKSPQSPTSEPQNDTGVIPTGNA